MQMSSTFNMIKIASRYGFHWKVVRYSAIQNIPNGMKNWFRKKNPIHLSIYPTYRKKNVGSHQNRDC